MATVIDSLIYVRATGYVTEPANNFVFPMYLREVPPAALTFWAATAVVAWLGWLAHMGQETKRRGRS